MKSYSSFLIRCWLIRNSGSQEEHSVLDIEHVQTGERVRVARLCEVQQWLMSRCQAACAEAATVPSEDEE